MEESFEVMHPVTRKHVNAVKRKYVLKMNAGTPGPTPEDALRPEIADYLENIAADWWVNQGQGTIEILCPEATHDIVAQTQTRFRG